MDDKVKPHPSLSLVEDQPVAREAEESVVRDLRLLLAAAERGELVGFAHIAQTTDRSCFTGVAGTLSEPLIAMGALEALKGQISVHLAFDPNPYHKGDGDGAA